MSFFMRSTRRLNALPLREEEDIGEGRAEEEGEEVEEDEEEEAEEDVADEEGRETDEEEEGKAREEDEADAEPLPSPALVVAPTVEVGR